MALALPDDPAITIMRRVHDIREKAWPNLRIVEFGDALLGRGGSMAAAATALHALQLVRRPHLAEYMTDAGRGREVSAARQAAPLASD